MKDVVVFAVIACIGISAGVLVGDSLLYLRSEANWNDSLTIAAEDGVYPYIIFRIDMKEAIIGFGLLTFGFFLYLTARGEEFSILPFFGPVVLSMILTFSFIEIRNPHWFTSNQDIRVSLPPPGGFNESKTPYRCRYLAVTDPARFCPAPVPGTGSTWMLYSTD